MFYYFCYVKLLRVIGLITYPLRYQKYATAKYFLLDNSSKYPYNTQQWCSECGLWLLGVPRTFSKKSLRVKQNLFHCDIKTSLTFLLCWYLHWWHKSNSRWIKLLASQHESKQWHQTALVISIFYCHTLKRCFSLTLKCPWWSSKMTHLKFFILTLGFKFIKRGSISSM